jgi:hypothetical protein
MTDPVVTLDAQTHDLSTPVTKSTPVLAKLNSTSMKWKTPWLRKTTSNP